MNFMTPFGTFEIVLAGSLAMFLIPATGAFAAAVKAFLNSSLREISFSFAIALISLIRRISISFPFASNTPKSESIVNLFAPK
jgi:hypothetical protein